jgi:threonine synthase
LHKLRAENRLDRDARVAAILTGHVLKDTDFIIKHRQQREQVASAVESK